MISRFAALSAASIIIAAAFWAAGMPPTQWLARVAAFFDSRGEPQAVSIAREQQQTAPTAVTHIPVVEPKSQPDGTDSSTSTVPMPLYLLGVSPGRNAAEGTASIGTSTDNPQSYAAGAILANGARLAEIHSDYVILTRGERKARLSLYDRRNAVAARVSDDLLAIGGDAPQAPAQGGSREILTDYIRPSPVYDGDSMLGYQVYPGANAAVFSQLGLRPGDVVAAIDGVPLHEPAQALEMLRQLTDGVALQLTIVRNQTRQQITADGSIILAHRASAQMPSRQASAGEPHPL